MNQPVFWDLQPPNGATISLVGSPLGNMTAHSMRLMFPAVAQKQVAEWLRQTADFLSQLPQGQSVQTPPPPALQVTPEAAPQQQPQNMPQFVQQAAPIPAPVGHNPEHFAPGVPVGHNNVPMPAAFGNGHAHHPAPAESATQPNASGPAAANYTGPSHLQPPPARPAVTHQQSASAQPMMMPPTMPLNIPPGFTPPMLGEDDQPFQPMTPMNTGAPSTQPAPPPSLDGDTERPPAPRRHIWDRQYEIGVARCTQCKLVATGTEEPYC